MSFGNLCSSADSAEARAPEVLPDLGCRRPGGCPRRVSGPLRARFAAGCCTAAAADGCCCDTSSVHKAMLGSDVDGDEGDMMLVRYSEPWSVRVGRHFALLLPRGPMIPLGGGTTILPQHHVVNDPMIKEEKDTRCGTGNGHRIMATVTALIAPRSLPRA